MALNIAVAGCGIAGLAAALLLHRQGHQITLFERFAKAQPLGSGLMVQPTGLSVLHQLGLADQIIDRGARIDRLFGQAGKRKRTVLDVRYSSLHHPEMFGIGIHRATLFSALFDAVQAANIAIQTGRSVNHSILSGERRMLVFEDDCKAGPFDLVVDALGARTSLAPPTGKNLAYGALWASLFWPEQSGFDPHALQQRYRAASVMAGILPIGQLPDNNRPQAAFFWSLRGDQLDRWRSEGLDKWKADVIALWPESSVLLSQIKSAEQLTFAQYNHRTVWPPVTQAMIHIGDAWHSSSPQLGQGANMALLDAWSLAEALKWQAPLDQRLQKAFHMRRQHVRLYQALSTVFTPVYQSDSRLIPLLRDHLVGPLSRIWPAGWLQAAMVSGLFGRPMQPLNLPIFDFQGIGKIEDQ